jgi:hypothetical protein
MFFCHFGYKQKAYEMNSFLPYPLHFQKVVYTCNGRIVAKSKHKCKQNRLNHNVQAKSSLAPVHMTRLLKLFNNHAETGMVNLLPHGEPEAETGC